jgi:Domain of unknown function (DUF4333)
MANSVARIFVICCAVAAVTGGVAGCSSGPKTVGKSDVEGQISAKMTDAAGNKPDSVSCPNDLTATVGSTLDCSMKVKGAPYGVNVTVTSIEGDQAKFDMVETVDKAQVASELSDQLTQQVGHKPDSVTCPDNLKGTQGATLRCQLTDGGQKYGVTVTVANIDGGDVNFNFKVDDQPS